jgi:hypothetical protein
MTGARAILSITAGAKKKIVAFATNVGYRIAIPHAPVNVLGRYSAARYEPLGYDVTVNCGVLRFTKAGGAGNAPDNSAHTIQPALQDILDSEDLAIEILDRKTGETLITVSQARLTDRGGNMGSRDMLAENWTFVGVVAGDDSRTEQSEGGGIIPPNNEAQSS